ncbi:MAG: hypothetical protein EOP45_10670, partial [Sphingobacteriaceae bacterium]
SIPNPISYETLRKLIPTICINNRRLITNEAIWKYIEEVGTFLEDASGRLDNQEDSIVMNNSAIQKGLFRAQSLKKQNETVKKNPSSSQTGKFMKPDRNKVDNLKDANYDKLNEEGYARVETKVKDGDVIIGMVNPKPTTKEDEKELKDSSILYKSVVPGTIDKVIFSTNIEGYPMMKMRIRSERIPCIGDKFSCYDTETEVLTNNGWIFFKDLTINHKVATLIKGDTLKYENPEALQKYKYDGNMYKIKSNQIDLCVTPNHKMWVAPRGTANVKKYKLERADEIEGKTRFYLKNVKNTTTENKCTFTLPTKLGKIPEIKLDMENWLIFFGIWIAEGFVKDNYAVSFSTHKNRVKIALKECCDMLGFDIKYTSDRLNDKENCITNIWNITHKSLVNYMKQFSVGAINKYLPEWVWGLTMNQARILIKGMMLGDGHTMVNGTMRYDTSSIKLANDFQRLCLHAGWSANIIVKSLAGTNGGIINGRQITSTVDSYRLTIITKQNNPKVNKNKKMDEFIKYSDYVYCCTVSSGVIYVRRNGIPTFSGNSRAGYFSLSQCQHTG